MQKFNTHKHSKEEEERDLQISLHRYFLHQFLQTMKRAALQLWESSQKLNRASAFIARNRKGLRKAYHFLLKSHHPVRTMGKIEREKKKKKKVNDQSYILGAEMKYKRFDPLVEIYKGQTVNFSFSASKICQDTQYLSTSIVQ